MNAQLSQLIKELIPIRRHLHTIPEFSFEEYETTAYIKKVLNGWGLELRPFTNLSTGGYCEIGKGRGYAFRADIDALPLTENEDHKIRSLHNGVMHACGHDFHTAIGIGLLRYFQLNLNLLQGKLRVIFQPGEEAAPGGAEKVITENIWQDIIGILSLHVTPQLEAGKIALIEGPVQASSTSLMIKISGPGGHTSKPGLSPDLINIAGKYITQLQNFFLLKPDTRNTIVFMFGSVHGGQSHNIIPQEIILRGTLRTFSNDLLNRSLDLIRGFSISFKKLHGVEIAVKFPTSCPVVVNDPRLSSKFLNYMQDAGRQEEVISSLKPSMGADDFAFYLKKIPGLYLLAGGAGTGNLHSGDLQLNENLIEPSIDFLSGFISSLLD